MTRLVSGVLGIALLLGIPSCAGKAQERTGFGKPNVLFIAVDDLNDWIGCLKGHPQALTPNMDRLAARGVLFTNAHCAAPSCNPSRAAVFSGRMPAVTGVWSNRSGSLDKLYPQAQTLPTSFSKSGYQTLGTGKLLHKGGEAAFGEYFSRSQRWSPLSKKSVQYSKKELPSKGTDNPSHVTKDSRGKKVVLPLNRMPSDRKPGTSSEAASGTQSHPDGLADQALGSLDAEKRCLLAVDLHPRWQQQGNG